MTPEKSIYEPFPTFTEVNELTESIFRNQRDNLQQSRHGILTYNSFSGKAYEIALSNHGPNPRYGNPRCEMTFEYGDRQDFFQYFPPAIIRTKQATFINDPYTKRPPAEQLDSFHQLASSNIYYVGSNDQLVSMLRFGLGPLTAQLDAFEQTKYLLGSRELDVRDALVSLCETFATQADTTQLQFDTFGYSYLLEKYKRREDGQSKITFVQEETKPEFVGGLVLRTRTWAFSNDGHEPEYTESQSINSRDLFVRENRPSIQQIRREKRAQKIAFAAVKKQRGDYVERIQEGISLLERISHP